MVPVVILAALLAWIMPGPLILYNDTPSLSEGIYYRAWQAPETGSIIAITPRAGAVETIRAAGIDIPPVRLLKPIAASAGDHVCRTAEGVAINGREIRLPVMSERGGKALPSWQECRTLAAGELFVIALRHPRSFDSRYFGPIRVGDVLGVYRPLLNEELPR